MGVNNTSSKDKDDKQIGGKSSWNDHFQSFMSQTASVETKKEDKN